MKELKKHPTTEWTEMYALGWSVIPLRSRTKKAAVKWQDYQHKRATTDELAAWALDTTKEHNVAVVAGDASGCVVLDLDNANAIQAATTLGLPNTVMVRTPRGLHVYFALPFFGIVQNVVGADGGKLPPGMDMRGDGGYVVGPGSYYVPTDAERAKGKQEGAYAWVDGCSPADVSLAQMPTWLNDALFAEPISKAEPAAPISAPPVMPVAMNNPPMTSRQQAYAQRALTGEVEAIATAARGTANDTVLRSSFRIAQIVAAGALDHDTAKAAILAAAIQRCDDAGEAGKTHENGWAEGLAVPASTVPAVDGGLEQRNQPKSETSPKNETNPLEVRRASDVFDAIVPEREFLLMGWLPVGAVTTLFGDGGVGKSLLAMQIATAVAAGIELWGLPTIKTPTLAIYCEDDDPELIRRQHNINASLNLNPHDLHTCYWSSRSGEQSILGAIDRGDFQPSALYASIRQRALDVGARLVVLDNISHMYGEDGNDPGKVTRFMSMLNRLALDINGCVLLLGHIAKAEGSRYAGTAAWSNAARNRLFFGRPADQRKAAANPDHRELIREKSNYAKTGEVLDVVWSRGAFALPTDGDSPAANPEELRDNATFLRHLSQLTSEEVALSSKRNAANYAPKVMATSDRHGVKHHSQHIQIAMERAMARLLSAEVIADYEPLGWMRSGRKPATGIKVLTAKPAVADDEPAGENNPLIEFMADTKNETKQVEPVIERVTTAPIKSDAKLIALMRAIQDR